MTINFKTNEIIISEAENKAAGIVDSGTYNDLVALTKAFPTYTITVKKERRTKDYLDKINYEFMESYIRAKNDKDNLIEFYHQRGCDENGVRIEAMAVEDYFNIRDWFLKEYPELQEYADEIKAAKEQKKAARYAEKMAKKAEEMKRFIELTLLSSFRKTKQTDCPISFANS
ncbi:MAG: hypothetical protein IKW92_09405 [Firmicutes bacterium]|nr:hypothetical protein [Bacillota bacterium]